MNLSNNQQVAANITERKLGITCLAVEACRTTCETVFPENQLEI